MTSTPSRNHCSLKFNAKAPDGIAGALPAGQKWFPGFDLKRAIILCWVGLICSTLHPLSAATVQWFTSTPDAAWKTQPAPVLKAVVDDMPYDMEIDLKHPGQTMEGWGGCFNELGWLALKTLATEAREEVLKQLFDPRDGLKFTVCRMPIGASDYAEKWYSLDDTPGDFELKHFNIDRDRTILIPYIKAAMKYQPGLQVWGSPWSPPAWMKQNNNYFCQGTNRFIQEEKYLRTYAQYLAKYVRAYEAEGIRIAAVAVQNEPFACQVFPSCIWSAEEMRDFIVKQLGPQFHREKIRAEIWFGTLNNNQFDTANVVLSDRRAMKYVSAVGLQWAGKNAVAEIHARYPQLRKIQTETECGDGSFDWKAAEYTFSLMKHYLNHGVSLYSYWNMVLDETGKSTWGWKQNALIAINPAAGKVTYTPEFHLFKHFTSFVPKGSVQRACRGNFDDAVAFTRPDGGTVLITVNVQDRPREIFVKAGKSAIKVVLPNKSFSTFVLP